VQRLEGIHTEAAARSAAAYEEQASRQAVSLKWRRECHQQRTRGLVEYDRKQQQQQQQQQQQRRQWQLEKKQRQGSVIGHDGAAKVPRANSHEGWQVEGGLRPSIGLIASDNHTNSVRIRSCEQLGPEQERNHYERRVYGPGSEESGRTGKERSRFGGAGLTAAERYVPERAAPEVGAFREPPIGEGSADPGRWGREEAAGQFDLSTEEDYGPGAAGPPGFDRLVRRQEDAKCDRRDGQEHGPMQKVSDRENGQSEPHHSGHSGHFEGLGRPSAGQEGGLRGGHLNCQRGRPSRKRWVAEDWPSSRRRAAGDAAARRHMGHDGSPTGGRLEHKDGLPVRHGGNGNGNGSQRRYFPNTDEPLQRHVGGEDGPPQRRGVGEGASRDRHVPCEGGSPDWLIDHEDGPPQRPPVSDNGATDRPFAHEHAPPPMGFNRDVRPARRFGREQATFRSVLGSTLERSGTLENTQPPTTKMSPPDSRGSYGEDQWAERAVGTPHEGPEVNGFEERCSVRERWPLHHNRADHSNGPPDAGELWLKDQGRGAKRSPVEDHAYGGSPANDAWPEPQVGRSKAASGRKLFTEDNLATDRWSVQHGVSHQAFTNVEQSRRVPPLEQDGREQHGPEFLRARETVHSGAGSSGKWYMQLQHSKKVSEDHWELHMDGSQGGRQESWDRREQPPHSAGTERHGELDMSSPLLVGSTFASRHQLHHQHEAHAESRSWKGHSAEEVWHTLQEGVPREPASEAVPYLCEPRFPASHKWDGAQAEGPHAPQREDMQSERVKSEARGGAHNADQDLQKEGEGWAEEWGQQSQAQVRDEGTWSQPERNRSERGKGGGRYGRQERGRGGRDGAAPRGFFRQFPELQMEIERKRSLRRER
jgi:hypothetical protein